MSWREASPGAGFELSSTTHGSLRRTCRLRSRRVFGQRWRQRRACCVAPSVDGAGLFVCLVWVLGSWTREAAASQPPKQVRESPVPPLPLLARVAKRYSASCAIYIQLERVRTSLEGELIPSFTSILTFNSSIIFSKLFLLVFNVPLEIITYG